MMKIIFAVLAYLLGAIPSGYLLFRWSAKKDIRDFGSRSIGATNVLRLKGWKFALPVAVFDVLKAALPVWLALRIWDDKRLALAAAFLVVLGHCFPVTIKFRGGKGVSTAMGAYAVLAFIPFCLSLGIFAAAIALTKYVSLGSLLATLSFPVSVYLLKGDAELALAGFGVFLIILIRHRSNLKRLFKGEERKFGEKASH